MARKENDFVTLRPALLERLLEVFQQPRTIIECGELMGKNYHTARRYTRTLLNEGFIQELPDRTEKGALLFVVVKERQEMLEWYFPLGEEMVTLRVAAERMSLFFKNVPNPGSLLAFLAQRSYWLNRNSGLDSMSPNRRYEGGPKGDPVVMRRDLRMLARSLEKTSRLLMAIAIREDFWESDNRALGSLFLRSGWEAEEIEAIHALAEEAFLRTFPGAVSSIATQDDGPNPSPPVGESFVDAVTDDEELY